MPLLRADQRLRLWRRGSNLALACNFRLALKTGGLGLPRSSSAHPRIWRNAAPAAADRRGTRARNRHDRPHGLCRRGRAHRAWCIVWPMATWSKPARPMGARDDRLRTPRPRPRPAMPSPAPMMCEPRTKGLDLEADLNTLAFQTAKRDRGHDRLHREAETGVQGQTDAPRLSAGSTGCRRYRLKSGSCSTACAAARRDEIAQRAAGLRSRRRIPWDNVEAINALGPQRDVRSPRHMRRPG